MDCWPVDFPAVETTSAVGPFFLLTGFEVVEVCSAFPPPPPLFFTVKLACSVSRFSARSFSQGSASESRTFEDFAGPFLAFFAGGAEALRAVKVLAEEVEELSLSLSSLLEEGCSRMGRFFSSEEVEEEVAFCCCFAEEVEEDEPMLLLLKYFEGLRSVEVR